MTKKKSFLHWIGFSKNTHTNQIIMKLQKITQKIKKKNRKIPAPWLNDASNQGGLWFYNFRQRARSQALFRGPRALWSMRGPPKEKGVHFKIFQSTYIVLSFCCIAAAEKKIFSSGGQKNHPKLLVYMKTKRSRHLQPLKAAAIGVCTMQ